MFRIPCILTFFFGTYSVPLSDPYTRMHTITSRIGYKQNKAIQEDMFFEKNLPPKMMSIRSKSKVGEILTSFSSLKKITGMLGMSEG